MVGSQGLEFDQVVLKRARLLDAERLLDVFYALVVVAGLEGEVGKLEAGRVGEVGEAVGLLEGEGRPGQVALDPVDLPQAKERVSIERIQLEQLPNLPPGLRPLFADGNRLLQVLWNLLSNAVKFTSAGGRIDVTLGDSTSGVRLCVADTGAGIPPEFLPFVFDRFRQGVDPHTASHGGLGLGLSIVRDLVEAHGGTVTVESPGEGLGTSFTVALPRGETPATLASPGAAGTTEAHQALAGLRILAVDNDEDSRTLLAAALHQQGASVVVAGSTSEAVDALGRLRFDGVVADIAVPGEDRRALIEQIRAAPEGRPLPAVAVTAGARIEDEAAALAAGFHGCLPKPFAPEELAEMLASMVSHGVE